ncbi:Integrase [Mucinivorans hirudinis]|uniref:Integrase n=1 Tax=Mucinivorans hirudinis TaxID=1433126 RepID=A0A060R7U3_9BACT|nr:Integrase [Mucinivorans hirudinis]
MRSTFKVLFYLKRNAPKKDGSVPVMCRITVDGTIAQFSCKLDVDPKLWDTTTGRLSGRTTVATETNRFLDKIRVGVNKHYQEICDRDNYVTAEKVKNAYLGLEMRHETLLKVYAQHNADYEKQVGKMKSERSLWKYQVVYKHLSEFIRYRYRVSDIALKELTPAFITDFELFLRTEKNHCTTTIWGYMMPLKRMIFIAQHNGWLTRNPFADYSISPEPAKRGFLNKDELRVLMDMTFRKKSYEVIRDLFIFCAFTGLTFVDMYNLTPANLMASFDGHLWVVSKRQKTGIESNIRLLDIPKRIIEKYEGMATDGKLLPSPCYCNCKNGIKVIAKMSGLNKRITWHMSRHSYATTICLSNGVPIETVSKMLGHTSIRTTQIYAKITNEKISSDMDALSQKLASLEQFVNNPI